MLLDDVICIISLINILMTSSRRIAVYICLSLSVLKLYLNAAKLFYFVYFTIFFVSQRDKYEIVTETHPFKNT